MRGGFHLLLGSCQSRWRLAMVELDCLLCAFYNYQYGFTCQSHSLHTGGHGLSSVDRYRSRWNGVGWYILFSWACHILAFVFYLNIDYFYCWIEIGVGGLNSIVITIGVVVCRADDYVVLNRNINYFAYFHNAVCECIILWWGAHCAWRMVVHQNYGWSDVVDCTFGN